MAKNLTSVSKTSKTSVWVYVIGVLILIAAVTIPVVVFLNSGSSSGSGPSPGPATKYSCNQSNNCVSDENGKYTKLTDCESACGSPSPGPSPGPAPGPSPGPAPGPSPGPSPKPKVGDSCGAKVNDIQFGVLGIKNLPTGQKIGKKIKSKTYAGLKDCVTFAQKNQGAAYLGVSTDKTSQVCNVYGNGNGGTAPTDEYTWMFTNSTEDCGCDVGFAPPDEGTSINDMCNACDSKFTDCVGNNFDNPAYAVVDPNKKLLQKSGEELCSSEQFNLCCNAEAGKCGYGIKSTKDANYGTLYLAKCGCKNGTQCGVSPSVNDQSSQIVVDCDATSWKTLNNTWTNYRCCKTDPNCKEGAPVWSGDKSECLFPNGFYVNWGDDDSLNNDAGVY